MTAKLTMLLLFGLLLCCHATRAARHLRHGDVRTKHEKGIRDDAVGPKSFILEKYGKHYKLTGGSTLARRRGDVVNIEGGAPANMSKADNTTAQVSNASIVSANQEKNDTVKLDSTRTDNSTAQLANNTIASSNEDKNKTLNDAESYTNATTSSNSNLNDSSKVNETVTNLKNTSSSNSDLVNTTQGANKTVASKSDIAIARDKEPTKDDKEETTNNKEADANNKEVATNNKEATNNKDTEEDTDKEAVMNATELRRKATPAALMGWEEAEQADDTAQINFEATPDNLPHNNENNISSEGNLTTIKLNLTNGHHDGEVVNAVIPGLDGNVGPNMQVDVIHGNHSNAPKRSSGSKPKKHIVYQITKPQMMINDFANKRKHVAYRRKHVVHVNKENSSKRKHVVHVNKEFPSKRKHVARVKAVSSNKRKHVVHVKAVPANRRKHVTHVNAQVSNKRRHVVHVNPAPANKRKHVSHVQKSRH